MSSERTRDRGNLFETTDKKKPSQPDFFGDCTIDGTAYEIRGWRREDQLTISIAPPRGDRNTYPPDVFKGALEAVPAPKKRAKDADAGPTPAWTGVIESDEVAYKISGFEKQGKSGLYWVLSFEKTEKMQKPRSDEYEPADYSDDA
jgi:hypothetical protein